MIDRSLLTKLKDLHLQKADIWGKKILLLINLRSQRRVLGIFFKAWRTARSQRISSDPPRTESNFLTKTKESGQGTETNEKKRS